MSKVYKTIVYAYVFGSFFALSWLIGERIDLRSRLFVCDAWRRENTKEIAELQKNSDNLEINWQDSRDQMARVVDNNFKLNDQLSLAKTENKRLIEELALAPITLPNMSCTAASCNVMPGAAPEYSMHQWCPAGTTCHERRWSAAMGCYEIEPMLPLDLPKFTPECLKLDGSGSCAAGRVK